MQTNGSGWILREDAHPGRIYAAMKENQRQKELLPLIYRSIHPFTPMASSEPTLPSPTPAQEEDNESQWARNSHSAARFSPRG